MRVETAVLPNSQGEDAAPALPRILVVDDELSVLLSLRRYLRKSFTVHTALDVDAAMYSLSTHGPFAVIMADMRMPGKDGLSLLSHALRTAPLTQRIMLTGDKQRETIMGAVNDAEVCRFLSKPCSPEEVRDALEEGVRRHEEASRALRLKHAGDGSAIGAMLRSMLGDDTQARPPVLRPHALSKLLAVVRQMVTPTAEACSVAVHFGAERPESEILGDPDQLSLAFATIMNAAVKACGRGGDVSLFVDVDPDEDTWVGYMLEKPADGRRSRSTSDADESSDTDAARHVVEMHGGAITHQQTGDALLTRVVLRRRLEKDFV